MLHLQFSKKFNTKPEEGAREKVEGGKKRACEVATLDTDNSPSQKKNLVVRGKKKRKEKKLTTPDNTFFIQPTHPR